MCEILILSVIGGLALIAIGAAILLYLCQEIHEYFKMKKIFNALVKTFNISDYVWSNGKVETSLVDYTAVRNLDDRMDSIADKFNTINRRMELIIDQLNKKGKK